MEAANLDYTVVKKPLNAVINGRKSTDVPNAFPTVRTDTNHILSVVGGITWVLSMTLAGYFLGTAFPAIVDHLELVIIFIIFLSILPGIIKYLQVKRKQRSGG